MLNDKNAVYLISAYGVFIGAMVIYGLALWLRRRSVERDERALDEAERDNGA